MTERFVLAAVNQDGEALEYASVALKADREIVLAAVKQNPRALRHASTNPKGPRDVQDIVLAAVKAKMGVHFNMPQ